MSTRDEKNRVPKSVQAGIGTCCATGESTTTSAPYRPVRDAILTLALLFDQFFGASCDSLEPFFHLELLLGRDILKCTFDESGVLAEDRNKYSVSLFRKRNSANRAIARALHTTDQSLFVHL